MKNIRRTLKFTGAGILILLLLFVGLVFFPFKRIAFPQKDYEVLIIENISVIDVKGDSLIQRQNIIITNDIIELITSEPVNKQMFSRRRIKIIDGTNRFLLPALWDMHVHLTKRSPDAAYPAFIQHGITHVRDMRGAYNERDPFAGVQSDLRNWNKRVNNYDLLGPRLHGYTSFAIDGPGEMFNGLPDFFNCRTPGEAIQLVNYFREKGVSLIKVYNNIPRDAFITLVKEARKFGIAVAGHKPVRVSTVEAADAGIKSLEHARFFIWDSYRGADSLIAASPGLKINTRLRLRMLHEHDTGLLKQNFEAFKKNNSWYCPTHLTRKDEAYADDDNYRARYDSINPILRFLSFEDLDAIVQEDTSALGRKVFMDFYIKGLE